MEFKSEFVNVSKESADERLGQVGVNREGEQMIIVEYNGYDDIEVVFTSTRCKVHTQYVNFLKGYVKNYKRVTHGKHGYIGQGKYRAEYIDDNGQRHCYPAYNMWRQMHERAENHDGKHPSYTDVTICEEWWDYQNFAAWVDENYYTIDDDFVCIDKDIINPESRCYSPENCCIVPNRINEIFKIGKKKYDDGKELPSGVSLRRDGLSKRYRARLKVFDQNYELITVSKTTKTPEEAFEFYKEQKEKFIKDIATLYENCIPERLYNALMNYEIKPVIKG